MDGEQLACQINDARNPFWRGYEHSCHRHSHSTNVAHGLADAVGGVGALPRRVDDDEEEKDSDAISHRNAT